jgi:hypothetical protein
MRIKLLLGVLLIAARIAPATAQSLPPIIDPIFHLTLAPALYEKGFQEVSPELLQKCGTAVRPTAFYRYWELASTKAEGVRYLMIAGVVKNTRSSKWSDDKMGAFLLLKGSTCQPIDPVDGVFLYFQSYSDDDGIRIARPIFTALADDAVQRYAHAFGSKAKFVACLHAQHRYPHSNDLEILKLAIVNSH